MSEINQAHATAVADISDFVRSVLEFSVRADGVAVVDPATGLQIRALQRAALEPHANQAMEYLRRLGGREMRFGTLIYNWEFYSRNKRVEELIRSRLAGMKAS